MLDAREWHYDIRTAQELRGRADVSTTMISTQVIDRHGVVPMRPPMATI